MKTSSNLLNEKLKSEITRSINLAPGDWMWATWRNTSPAKRPEPSPFDYEKSLAVLNDIFEEQIRNNIYGWVDINWVEKANLVTTFSAEEARFWLSTIFTFALNEESTNQRNKKSKLKKLLEKIVKEPVTNITWQSLRDLLREQHTNIIWAMGLLIPNVFSLEDIVELLLDETEFNLGNGSNWQNYAIAVYRQYFWPYLSDADKEIWRKKVIKLWDSSKWPQQVDYYTARPFFYFAAYLGLHDLLLPLVESLDEKDYLKTGEESNDPYNLRQEIVFGLRDPKLVDFHMRRLKIKIRIEDMFRRPIDIYLKAWLAHTEYSALDYITESILTSTNKEKTEKLINIFALVNAPEVAPQMLELMLSSKSPRTAKEWLEKNPVNAIAGLMKLTLGRSRLAEAAINFLRSFKKKGYLDLIVKFAKLESPEIFERVQETVINYIEKEYTPFDEKTTPAWLKTAISELKKTLKIKQPSWINTLDLPVIAVDNNKFNDEQVSALIVALQKSALDSPNTFVLSVKANVSATVLDNFAWALFQQWLAYDAPSKENWVLTTLGLFGGDSSALKLGSMIRVWPGEGQNKRAVSGLECLRKIGTDTALMQINGIAQKLKFKALKEKANECIENIAKDRGLTRAELEDRIVPDCDLDEQGSRQFDFGSRQFHFVLSHEMKALVKDEDNKLKTDLPKPNTKDDAEKAKQAIEEWKLLKKQIAEVAKIQNERLEQAMVSGRKWNKMEFEMLLVNHPLMINLVRLLVWGAYDSKGKLATTFRVTEDKQYANSSDEPVKLNDENKIAVVHPMQLSEQERKAWGELLSDYEIIQPFPQLGRQLFSLDKKEKTAKAITRFSKTKIPATALVGTLEKLGWMKAMADEGSYVKHYKIFYPTNVTAFVSYQGGDGDSLIYWEEQNIEECFFLSGFHTEEPFLENDKTYLPLNKIDPIVISEVLNDLNKIVAKGK